jgi:hypothetical protein
LKPDKTVAISIILIGIPPAVIVLGFEGRNSMGIPDEQAKPIVANANVPLASIVNPTEILSIRVLAAPVLMAAV